MIKKVLLLFFLLCLLTGAGAAGLLYWLIVLEPGDEIAVENIRRILGRESPVFYNDGQTPLGAFFADAHRQYVDYEEIPEVFIDAIVAAEDNRFFSHYGFDLQGIARAAIKNFQAGRVVQGGSTITQQTAKNLFKREERSYRAKLKELIYALRLEYRYSKGQILEFYSNQFYVSGNGHGLGVAARYYFDKTPPELSLVEAAYIAGSVKRPNYYNPFIKKDERGVEEAKERGRRRVDYVLKAMRDLGMIDETTYLQARDAEIPFDQGRVGYPLDYVMELVTEAVASPRIVEALAAQGIDNISTSGIRIITTVDQDIQRQTLAALRKQLSYLDVRLRGYEREEVQADLADLDYQGDRAIAPGRFVFGTITGIDRAEVEVAVEVKTGNTVAAGVIDEAGLADIVEARVKWEKNRWTEPEPGDTGRLLDQLREGDRVWVSVRENEAGSQPRFALERFPEIQGGAIVLRRGRIIAVAGGSENRFFNRAIYARRTMGSSFKPFVYSAALQLGWNAADLLPNRRDVFVYQNQAYFPRPDHKIEYERVSMSWAGVKSENLASVWLAAHLCDHLSGSQFEDVAARLDLVPRLIDGEPEPYRLFRSRIRDRYGIVLDEAVVRQAAYRKTIGMIEADMLFAGLGHELETVRELHYGRGFDRFRAELNQELNRSGMPDWERRELILRKQLLTDSYLSLEQLHGQLRLSLAAAGIGRQGGEATAEGQRGRGRLYYDRVGDRYLFDYPARVPEYAELVSGWRLRELIGDLDPFGKREFVERIWLGGRLSVAAFTLVEDHLRDEFEAMRALLPYSLEVLRYVDDYRILVGLTYLVEFGAFAGIESELEPVLSFPLGSNVTTLLETTRVYEALVTGEVLLSTEADGRINNTLTIIDRIESEDGVVLYRPEWEIRRAVSQKTSLVLGHILENTVKFGTGRYADRNVKLEGSGTDDDTLADLGLSVPLFGKTGTANRYTNASFFGYLPALNEAGNGMVTDGGYGIGVYVGFDDNQPMRRRGTRVAGSLGALPAWVDIANTIVARNDFSAALDPVDLSFYGLAIRRQDIGQKNLGIDGENGGRLVFPVREIDPLDRYQPSILTFGAAGADGRFSPARSYAPFWLNQGVAQPAVEPSVAAEP